MKVLLPFQKVLRLFGEAKNMMYFCSRYTEDMNNNFNSLK